MVYLYPPARQRPTDTGTYDIPEHFYLTPERVVLIPE